MASASVTCQAVPMVDGYGEIETVDDSDCEHLVKPSKSFACNTQVCPSEFCTDNNCNGHGTCDAEEGKCICDTGYDVSELLSVV